MNPANPDQNCTVGHYCPEGTAHPLPCEDGTYNEDESREECDICPAGKYCVDGVTRLSCPQGVLRYQIHCFKGRFGQFHAIMNSILVIVINMNRI